MSACGFGPDPVERRHHPTGRDFAGKYLDPKLIIESCHSHHELCHDDWKTLGLQELDQEASILEENELRMRRLASNLARLACSPDADPLLVRLARSLPDWANDQARSLQALDECHPGWREDRRFYRTG